MTAIVQAGANQPLSFTVGDDVSLRLTVTENSLVYSWTGAVITTSIIANGAAVATNFTTTTSAGGILDLSLTDTETTTLGLGTFDYWVKVTKASVTSTWVAGQLTMHAAQYGAASSLSSSLSITTAASTTLAITVSGYGDISLTLAGYATVADVLPRAATPQEMPPDSALSMARLDIFPAELSSGTQVLTTQRQTMVYFQVSRDITVNTVAFCGDTTASATITIGVLGLCFIGDDGHIYPAAKSANDTAMFGVASALTAKAFDTTSGWPASVTLTPGRWYAATVLMDGTTMPTLVAGPAVRNALQGNSRSRRTSVVTAFLDFQSRSNMGGLTYQTPWCSVRAGGSANKARTCVLLGDSFLASNGYPEWLGRGNAQGGSRLHFIQNKGTGGDTLTGMIARWTADVAAYEPEWVVIHGGTNDIHTSGDTSAQVIANYETLIGLAQAAGISALLCTPPPNTGSTAGMKTTLGTVRTWLLALSATGVTVVDTGIALSTGDGVTADAALLVDTVHPNSTTGRAALANAVDGVIATIT